ncbi:hypothetical protein PaelaDRAFT_5662 [Paenibacillus lactis 154]|uniref:Uncharacterized protein n=1 Tax=Paenibacillus lactis 154 TaxID=743719 RepID=G4HNV1_9BACL|nr:hypothetical protein PaelaDRAFT_5662 [Paenibacillus lactis 154]
MKITGVAKYKGDWKKPGDELRKVEDEIGKSLVSAEVAVEIEPLDKDGDGDQELQELRERAKTLGVQNAGRLGEAKLKEGIAEKEAEFKLKELQEKAFELGIADAYEKNAATLAKKIEAAEQK